MKAYRVTVDINLRLHEMTAPESNSEQYEHQQLQMHFTQEIQILVRLWERSVNDFLDKSARKAVGG